MISKLCTYGRTHDRALQRMLRALRDNTGAGEHCTGHPKAPAPGMRVGASGNAVFLCVLSRLMACFFIMPKLYRCGNRADTSSHTKPMLRKKARLKSRRYFYRNGDLHPEKTREFTLAPV